MMGFRGADAPASRYAEEAFVKRSFLTSVASLALATSSMLVSQRSAPARRPANGWRIH